MTIAFVVLADSAAVQISEMEHIVWVDSAYEEQPLCGCTALLLFTAGYARGFLPMPVLCAFFFVRCDWWMCGVPLERWIVIVLQPRTLRKATRAGLFICRRSATRRRKYVELRLGVVAHLRSAWFLLAFYPHASSAALRTGGVSKEYRAHGAKWRGSANEWLIWHVANKMLPFNYKGSRG